MNVTKNSHELFGYKTNNRYTVTQWCWWLLRCVSCWVKPRSIQAPHAWAVSCDHFNIYSSRSFLVGPVKQGSFHAIMLQRGSFNSWQMVTTTQERFKKLWSLISLQCHQVYRVLISSMWVPSLKFHEHNTFLRNLIRTKICYNDAAAWFPRNIDNPTVQSLCE